MDGRNTRLIYLDFIRGFAILLVLMHHVFQYFTPLFPIVEYITDFHVGLFFVVSGILESKQNDMSFYRKLRKKYRRLIVPYLIFTSFETVLKFVVLFVTRELSREVVVDEIFQILTIGNGPIWFLYRLFIIELLFYPIKKYVLNKTPMFGFDFTVLFTLILLWVMQNNNGYFVQSFRSVLMGLFYLLIGYVIAKCNVIEKTRGGGTRLYYSLYVGH